MSYVIEYARQFLRSESGITPVWLHGDNNVWEPTLSGRERRGRNWSCFMNLIGVSERVLMENIESMCDGEYQTHWMKNNRWMNDASVRRWAKTGVKQACTVEELLEKNRWKYLYAHLSVWGKDLHNSIELKQYISNTEDLDNWIEKAKVRMEGKAVGESVYPILSFPTELFIKPLESHAPRTVGDTILRVTGGNAAGMYVHKITARRCQFTPYPNAAYRYHGKAAAKKAADNISLKIPGLSLEAISLTTDDTKREEPA